MSNLNCIRVFVHEGSSDWVHAVRGFANHEKSLVHRECSKVLSEMTKNVSQELNKMAKKDAQLARAALIRIFTSVKYLANQGQAIRDHTDNSSNLQKLINLTCQDNEALQLWMKKKSRNK